MIVFCEKNMRQSLFFFEFLWFILPLNVKAFFHYVQLEGIRTERLLLESEQ